MRLKGRAALARRKLILERDGHRCRDCGFPGRLEIHHVIPLHRGGSDEEDNLLTLCRACHLAKHARSRDEGWRALVEELSRAD